MRAFAVFAVIAYHLDATWAQGGLLGVTIFFVLSGYLITGILVRELDNTGTISLSNFWVRRVRRIIPAILTVIIVTIVLFAIFNHVLLTKMRPDILPSLFFFNNWWQIFHDVSYFEALGSPSPLTHFWSLAIEEQFYVVWPILLLIVFKIGFDKTTIRRATLVLAIVSVLLMAILYVPGEDPSRVYYGTDTRAFSLLIGAWLAIYTNQTTRGGNDLPSSTLESDGIGLASFILLILMIAFISGYSDLMYRGGIFIASLLAAALIYSLAIEDGILAHFFALKPFVLIGKWSYSIYLWHYPIILLFKHNSAQALPWYMAFLAIIVTVACAAASYYLIEDPIRHGAIGEWLRSRYNRFNDSYIARNKPLFLGYGGLCVVALLCVMLVPSASAVENAEIYQNSEASVGGLNDTASDGEGTEFTEEPAEEEVADPEEQKYDVILIGDSVALRATYEPYPFAANFPNGLIDAAINRRIPDGTSIYSYYAGEKITSDNLVFCLGNNGPAYIEDTENLIATVGEDKNIFFVNSYGSPYSDVSNATFEQMAYQYSNVYVINWVSTAASNGAYLEGDGMHLTVDGAVAFCDVVYNYVAPYLPAGSTDDSTSSEDTSSEN